MPFVIEKTKDPLYKEGIEVGIEKGIQKGIEKGIQKGIEKGKEEERIAFVKSLLKLNMDIDFIEKATGFSKERIEKIKEEFLKK